MLTQQEKGQVNRTVGKIKDMLDIFAPEDLDTLKVSVEIYKLVLQSLRTCPYCGTDLEVEAEMFSQDKLFTGHSCKGTYSKEV